MNKAITTTCVFLLLSLSTFAQDSATTKNNFLVHITAFNEKRPISYFTNLENVFMSQDNKEIWHYYLGGYKTLEEADSVRRKVFELGYAYVYIIDVEKVRRECLLTCGDDPSIPDIMQQLQNLTHLLFDFGKSSLKPDSKLILNHLTTILNQNGKYQVEFKGHTDNIGSPEINQELSEKRTESVAQYVQFKALSAERIKQTSYGMEMPIAKNQRKGKDCPEGRRFNRRVEIIIMDIEGNVLNALVDPLDIPNELLYDGPRLESVGYQGKK